MKKATYTDTLTLDHPASIKCWQCGNMTAIDTHDIDQKDEEATCEIYGCDKCNWWYEFEFTPDNDDDIICIPVVRNKDNDEEYYHWMELRDLPHFWMPRDGWYFPKVTSE